MTEQYELISKICQGNPGAIYVVKELQWFTQWDKMLHWLAKSKYKGDKLWELYKDVHHENFFEVGEYIQAEMSKEEMLLTKEQHDELKYKELMEHCRK